MRRILFLLIATDKWLMTVLCLGATVNETISGAAFRQEAEGKWFGRTRPFIDWLFSPLESDHCRKAFEDYANMRFLPKEYRHDATQAAVQEVSQMGASQEGAAK